MSTDAPTFRDIAFTRHSTRGFLPEPVPKNILTEILQEAQCSPSNCNTQPWNTHIVTGHKLAELRDALVEELRTENYSLDFSFDKNDYPAPYKERASEQGRAYYQALGVAREDSLSRAEVVERNVRFFDAPHIALLFMPAVGDSVRVAADVGMYAQTFLLSLTSRGYSGVPQAVLSYFADTVRRILNVSDEHKLLFGISFGLADETHPASQYREGRVSIDKSVSWHD